MRLGAVFSDGLVLQREKELKIWGTGEDSCEVTVSLCGQKAAATVINGKWQTVLPPLPAATGCELVVSSGGESLTVRDVAIGEVWIAGGQSNMEMCMRFDAEAEGETDADPLFRFFDVPRISYDEQEQDEDFSEFGFWRSCSPGHTSYFSATAYYFGKMLRKTLNVPVGIVGCNYGGTSASCWVPEEDLLSDSGLKSYIDDYEAGLAELDTDRAVQSFRAERRNAGTPRAKAFSDALWRGAATPEEYHEILNKLMPENAPMPDVPVIGPAHPRRPSALYHRMLKTITPYATRGVIWYQGESDDCKAELYAKLFSTLIARWRADWQEALPFLFVQLAPFERWLHCEGSGFPAVRRQQEIVSQTVENAYMASIMDCGERTDIHPKHKRPVGERLARLALGKIYGQAAACDPPEAVSCEKQDGGVIVRFLHCGEGLEVKGETLNGLQVLGVSGEIGKYQVYVSGDKLEIKCAEPVYEVRFACQPYVEANLYGNDGLCAKPFALAAQ